MEVLGVIPARGGSKGIPKKNLALLAGKPLLAYTCEAALQAKRLTRVIVSTDDQAIAACARDCGIDVPFFRPPHLAADDTPMLEVLCYVLETLRNGEGYRPDVLVLLQPTSPLRTASHIDEAVRVLVETQADSVVSVTEVPHQFRPSSLLQLDGDYLIPCLNGPIIGRRQDKPVLYARNGPAVLAVRESVVVEQRRLYGDHCHPLVMPPESSIDIDTPFDLRVAETLLASRTPAI